MPNPEFETPVLTIGMPVYNGAQYIECALRSLMAQDFQSWRMIVSDNCSTDDTASIVERLCAQDPRITLVQQERNLGAAENFIFLARSATTPYFMWAASDDEWTESYISECIRLLALNKSVGIAGGRVANTDVVGIRLREFPSFSSFSSDSPWKRLARFVYAREVDGKANMIYSVFRTTVVQSVCEIPNVLDGWGADMGFVAAMLARSGYRQSDKATLLKQVFSDSDKATARLLARKSYSKVQFRGNYPPDIHQDYVDTLTRGMPNWKFTSLVRLIMCFRRMFIPFRRCFVFLSHALDGRK